MSKKYVFLKLFPDLTDSSESEILSEMEGAAFFDNLQAVDNVFQLNQWADLKLVIGKNPDLQHIITFNTAPYGRHGYLWSGDHLPDIENFLARSAFFSECYIFQRYSDFPPAVMSTPYNKIANRFEIYNWWVFHFWSFQFLFSRAAHIRKGSKNEVEIDRSFQSFWSGIDDHFRLFSRKKHFSDHILTAAGADHNVFNRDKSSRKQDRSRQWLRAIVNHLDVAGSGSVYIPFCGSGTSLFEASLVSGQLSASEINPLRAVMAGSNISGLNFAIEDYPPVISSVMSNLKSLQATSNGSQGDLFFEEFEKEFLEFWRADKQRFESLNGKRLSTDILKGISIIRFLIEHQTISKKEAVNTFLTAGLVNVLSELSRKKRQPQFCEAYHKMLRSMYLDLYTLNKIKSFTANHKNQAKVFKADAGAIHEMDDESQDAVVALFPSRINRDGFKEEAMMIRLLNLDEGKEQFEHLRLGNTTRLIPDSEKWKTEISEKGPLFSVMGSYGRSVLDRLAMNNRTEEAAALLRLWTAGLDFLKETTRITRPSARCCLALKNLTLKIEDQYEEIYNGQVFRELIEIHQAELGFTVQDSIVKKDGSGLFGIDDTWTLLIFHKNEEDVTSTAV